MSTTEPNIEVSERVNTMFETVAHPIRGSLLFYSLYYLAEVEGVAEAEFDFRQVRDAYLEGFWWYGIYAALSEVSNVNSRYLVEGRAVSQYNDRAEVRTRRNTEPRMLKSKDMEPEIRRLAGRDRAKFEILRELFFFAGGLDQATKGSEYDRPLVSSVMRRGESIADAVSHPIAFLEAVGSMFHKTQTIYEVQGGGPSLAKTTTHGQSGWLNDQWNGPGWAGIVDHLLRRDDLPATAWVDQSWSIQHNNNNWVDKIAFSGFDQRLAREIAPFPDRGGTDFAKDRNVLKALDHVLDLAREGEISEVLDWAEEYGNEVEINLRRWRRVLDL